jgi:hypothetical protein
VTDIPLRFHSLCRRFFLPSQLVVLAEISLGSGRVFLCRN